MNICFATNNKNKIKEIKAALEGLYTTLSLNDIDCHDELPENQSTIEGNSLEKTQFVWDNYAVACFGDDTGLEVDALNGAPGVYSARYAGEDANAENNMALLLKNMEGISNRAARFKTVITLFLNDKPIQFEGIVEGTIRESKVGADGFGYDPIFQPNGYDITFAEMDLAEKNKISHRGLAVQKLIAYLKSVGSLGV